MSDETRIQKIFEALEDDRYEWRTSKGIAKQTGISEEEVLLVLDNSTDSIVQSSVPSIKGAPLYTTKRHFQAKSSAFDKIQGAFKGRIR